MRVLLVQVGSRRRYTSRDVRLVVQRDIPRQPLLMVRVQRYAVIMDALDGVGAQIELAGHCVKARCRPES